MNEKYHGYFYILEGDMERSVTRFADFGLRYVVAFGHQSMANFLKSRYSRAGSRNRRCFTLVSDSDWGTLNDMHDFVSLLPI